MDPRLTPFNGRVAHAALRGRVQAEVFTEGRPARIGLPLADLSLRPGGPRARQLLFGAPVTVLERRGTDAFVQAALDGHAGWIAAAALALPRAATHRVCAAASHLYPRPALRSPAGRRLSLGALVTVSDNRDGFARTPEGWLPATHLRPLATPETDPVAVAARLIGTPYLWGGNSRDGIDCSGLVQAGLSACARPCPPDSDLQEAALGQPLPPQAALQRGDLVFWSGHVGWMQDATTLLHANAHHMSVAVEPLARAVERIRAAQEEAPRPRRL